MVISNQNAILSLSCSPFSSDLFLFIYLFFALWAMLWRRFCYSLCWAAFPAFESFVQL